MLNFGLLIQFIFVFGLIVFVHEFGHFLIAKMVGVDVEEFGFGYPPRLVKLFSRNRRGGLETCHWIRLDFAVVHFDCSLNYLKYKCTDLKDCSYSFEPGWEWYFFLGCDHLTHLTFF